MAPRRKQPERPRVIVNITQEIEKTDGVKRENEDTLDLADDKKQRLDENIPPVVSTSNTNSGDANATEGPVIGIDLGTTYSCVGVFQHGKVEIIANDQGFKITPSYVAFTDGEMLVGDTAKAQETRNLESTIFGAKRLIGRKFNDDTIQTDMKNFPFKVIDINDKPKIEVKVGGETKTFFPEEISAMVLSKMKETAEAYLGKKVTNAVITVPAYFNDAQRQATKDAATIAKLNVLRIINEPTAAAIAYGLEKKVASEHKVMIFDLGGGTFDVSILGIDKDFFHVKSTAGDTHLGGEDFDNNMVDYFVEEFKRKHKKDITENKKAIRRLKTACERAKRILSSSTLASVDLDSLHDGIDFFTSITRARFEELNAVLFRKTLEPVEKSIRDAGIDKSQIREVVLVGGSTRIPRVQKLLQDFFDGKELCNSINPDEAVAYGAAIQAAILNGNTSKEVQGLVLIDVTPLSLGIQTCGNNTMSVIIKRNTTIPTKQSMTFSTLYDNQTSVVFSIYEGEHPNTNLNNFLGKFRLTDIPPGPKGSVKFEVTFEIDANGILKVTAVDKRTGKTGGITLAYNKNCFSQDEIERMIKDAEEFKAKLSKQKTWSAAKNSLESSCVDLKRSVQDIGLDAIIESDRDVIVKKCDEVLNWLQRNDSTDVAVFEQLQKELNDAFNTITTIAKYPSRKEEKYREFLNVTKKASKEEILEGFKRVSRKFHPDKFKGDKEVGEMMFRVAVDAEKISQQSGEMNNS